MALEVDGNSVETTATGFLVNFEDWNEEVAKVIAAEESIEMSDKHWDLVNFLREEYKANQSTPNTRTIVKAMSKAWGEKVSQKDLYELFPGDPSKQGGRIAGCPESRRKGGY